MEKLKAASKDIARERILAIGKLCPGCVQEGRDETGERYARIDFEMLKAMLGVDDLSKNEFFEFSWVGKKQALLEANRLTEQVLRPCIEKSVGWNRTENIYIEGDNLEALKILQASYDSAVDVIYIDPPYNTGKDFIYLDNFRTGGDEFAARVGAVDETGRRMFRLTEASGRFHSAWCSMMYSRLLLARNLLSENGVCFISIDDNEQHNLRKICDEIFGQDRFLGTIIQRKGNAQNDAVNIQKNHEYILVYVKNRKYRNGKEIPILSSYEESVRKVFVDESGRFYYKGSGIVTGGEGGTLNHRKNLGYTIYYHPKTYDKLAVMDYDTELAAVSNDASAIYTDRADLLEQGYEIIRPPKKGDRLGCWTWSCEKFNAERDQILITPNRTVIQKVFVDPDEVFRSGKQLCCKKTGRRKNTRSIIEFSTSAGTADVTRLFGTKVFDNPKNVDMLRFLIGLVDQKDVLVMDFFSGTASTAEAVMRMNADDGQHRRFIMVQIPEAVDPDDAVYAMGYRNICEIGEDRIRKAAEAMKAKGTRYPFDGGMRVFRVDESNQKRVSYAPEETTQELLAALETNIREDRTDQDLLFGCLSAWGLPLSLPYDSDQADGIPIHILNGGGLIACFAENVSEAAVREIAGRKPERAVFRDSAFRDCAAKINAEAIFGTLSPGTDLRVL